MKAGNAKLLAEIDMLENITQQESNTLEVVKHIEALEGKLEVINDRINDLMIYCCCFCNNYEETNDLIDKIRGVMQ